MSNATAITERVPLMSTAAVRLLDGYDGPSSMVVEGLEHVFGAGETSKRVLVDIRLDVLPGEMVIMTGASGCGKTTLLTLIGGLRKAQQDRLTVLGRPISRLSPTELVELRREIGFIFQAHNLFPALTALQNVRMALELLGGSARANRQRATELLTRLGLDKELHKRPAQLSGGQRQRVAIARALANRPRLILADEPTAALDEKAGAVVVQLLKEVATQERATILLVTHDQRVINAADRKVTMEYGKIVKDSRVREAAAISEFLLRCDLFKGLTETNVASIMDRFMVEKHADGAHIIRQGDVGDRFYLIRRGCVDVRIRDAQGDRVVNQLGEGEFFGERALIKGEPRSASIVAQGEVTLYTLDKAGFDEARETSESFQEQVRRAIFSRG